MKEPSAHQLCHTATRRFKELEECAEEVELKHLLRKSLQDWEAHTEAWLSAPLFAIQPSAMDEVVHQFNKVAYRVERGLPSAKVRLPSPSSVLSAMVPPGDYPLCMDSCTFPFGSCAPYVACAHCKGLLLHAS
jgi:hypothetical protein